MTLIGGKYRLLKQIGEGAMGVVSSAVNTSTGGQVAIKLILRSEPELRQRLLREAQACGAIRHKNVVQVYDVGMTESGDPFLVMELLHGETLAALLARKRRLAPHEACAIGRDVARALAAAHAVPIVHRDLKPANIFLHTEPGDDEAIVKVVDFGVSKNLQVSDGLRTVAGGAVGSPLYMSPEQARADRALDHRADLWSLGVVLYEMLTGERPFAGDALEVVHKILQDPIPRVGKRLRKLDPDVDRIVAGCLTRDPAQRLGPAGEIAKQLDKHTLGAMRDPLPSLAESGAYDLSPTSGAGSGGAALSPGYGSAALVAASPGIGATDLRPPSSGAALAPKSAGQGNGALHTPASASGSGGAAMHRSGPWGDTGDDDGATIPIEPQMLQARLANAAAKAAVGPSPSQRGLSAPPSDPGDWGPAGGGTIPIQALSSGFPGVGWGPPPVANPPAATPPPASAAAPATTSLRPGTTIRMDPLEIAAAAAVPPKMGMPVVAAAGAAPAKKQRDKVVLGALGVMAVSAVAAVLIWFFVPVGGRRAPEPLVTAVANTAQQSPPSTVASAQPTATAESAHSATITADPAPSGTAQTPDPTTTSTTSTTAPKPPAPKPPSPTQSGKIKPAPTPTVAPQVTAPTTTAQAPAKVCKNLLGKVKPCPK